MSQQCHDNVINVDKAKQGQGGSRALFFELNLEGLDLVFDLAQFITHVVVGSTYSVGVVSVEVVDVIDEEVVAGLWLLGENPLAIGPPHSSTGSTPHWTLACVGVHGGCRGRVVCVSLCHRQTHSVI